MTIKNGTTIREKDHAWFDAWKGTRDENKNDDRTFNQWLIDRAEAAEASAKSNGEMWAQASRLYAKATEDMLDYAAKCGRMRNELERVTAERDMLKAALEINAAMRGNHAI